MMNDVKHKHAKLIRDSRERKEHFRMYKAGRQWLFAGVVTMAVGIGGLFTTNQSFAATDTAHGDTVAGATTTAVRSDEVTQLQKSVPTDSDSHGEQTTTTSTQAVS